MKLDALYPSYGRVLIWDYTKKKIIIRDKLNYNEHKKTQKQIIMI